MSYFPTRDLTPQVIKSSYQDLLQKYASTSSYIQILDGLGYSLFSIPSASAGGNLLFESGSAYVDNIAFNTTNPASSSNEGYVWWDSDNHTLAIQPDISSSTLQVGQELWLRYTAGSDILNGDAIYISATDEDGHPVCNKAIADSSRTKYNAVAIATHNNPSGSHGFATIIGVVNDLDTSAYPPSAPLFLSTTTPGGYRIGPPDEPNEAVLLGYCSRQDATVGRIFVNIVGLPDVFRSFAGVTQLPTITNNGDGTISIGTGSAALNSLSDGSGTTRNFLINSASLSVPVGITDISYVVADYNSGNPVWMLVSGSENVDSIQRTRVYSVTHAVTGDMAWASWDEPGNLLANKLFERITETHGIVRTDGMTIGESGSRYVTVSSGSFWIGTNDATSEEFNSDSNALLLLYHSASAYTSSVITQYVNDQVDNGTNLVTLDNNKYVVNYLYKSAMNKNRCMIMLSDEYAKLSDAQASQPPTVPGDLLEGGFLVGRAIYIYGGTTAIQIDSAFVQQFTPRSIIQHNDLVGIQGGTTDEYYHLTAAEYADLNTSYVTTTTDYAVTVTDDIVYASASTAPITITLLAAGATNKLLKIKKIDSSGYHIIISGSSNIEFDTELRLTQRGSSVTLHSDANQYWIH